jgi:SAM-dependent methyltransferase
MPDVGAPNFWEQIYRQQQTGWDLGRPTPVFRRLLDSGRFRPGRIIVPGAGSGHDAREFARRGFDVTAVDFAAEAVGVLRAQAEPGAALDVIQADIFELPHALDGIFDYVLEYMCFCAINPQRRPDYADLVMRLLKPGGQHIHLAFPLGKREGGPPFAVLADGVEFMFERRGFTLVEREVPPDSVPSRCGCEELLIFRKG